MPEKLTSRVLERLAEPTREAFEPLLDQEPKTTDELRQTVSRYMDRLESSASRLPSVDLATARDLADQCMNLLDTADDIDDDDAHRLIRAGVRYFVTAADAESDLGPSGFDDDREVLTAVREELDL